MCSYYNRIGHTVDLCYEKHSVANNIASNVPQTENDNTDILALLNQSTSTSLNHFTTWSSQPIPSTLGINIICFFLPVVLNKNGYLILGQQIMFATP